MEDGYIGFLTICFHFANKRNLYKEYRTSVLLLHVKVHLSIEIMDKKDKTLIQSTSSQFTRVNTQKAPTTLTACTKVGIITTAKCVSLKQENV